MNQNESRRLALAARRDLNPAVRIRASTKIAESIRCLRRFKMAQRIAVYWPLQDEVDISSLIDELHRRQLPAYLPVIGPNNSMLFGPLRSTTAIVNNRFGIPEPDTSKEDLIRARQLELVIAPLVAFDKDTNRIGMGGGFYDRAFEFLRYRKHWRRPHIVGVAFDAQQIYAIQAQAWDVQPDEIITESAMYKRL